MSDRLNVLLVVLGGARPDHFSAAGYERETTPFLDAMGREGVRFTQAFTTATWGPSACASLLTGLFPSAHGATSESGMLPPTRRLLAEHFAASGYRTAAFCTDAWIAPATGFGRGFDRFHAGQGGGRIAGRAADYARRASDRVLGRRDSGARRTNRALVEWVAAGAEPFFAFVHYRETALGSSPPAPYDRTFLPPRFDPGRVRSLNLAAAAVTTGEDLAMRTALYDGALRYLDMRLKELAEALARLGRWENTLLVATADRGRPLGERGAGGGRFLLHDAALRVPLIVRCPRKLPQGFVVEDFTQHTDVAPTVLELAGIETREPMQGRRLLGERRATAGADFVIAEDFRPVPSELARRLRGVDPRSLDVRRLVLRTRREKYVWHSDEANELYDLLQDRGEERNLAGSEAERAARLRRRLFDWLASAESLRLDPAAEPALAAVAERSGSAE
jgi:arylsulfatase A-like enzyme